MFADLKEKLARSDAPAELPAPPAPPSGLKARLAHLDRKRLYTALTALAIAGAAGHFMQRNSDAPAPQIAAATVAVPAPAPAAPAVQLAQADAPAAVAADIAPVTDDEPAALDLAQAEPVELPIVPEVTRSEIDPLLGMMLSDSDAPARSLVMPALAEIPTDAADPLPVEPIQLAAVTDADLATPSPLAPSEPDPVPLADDCAIDMSATPVAGALLSLSIKAPCNSGEDVEFAQGALQFSEQLDPDGSLDLLVPAISQTARISATFADGAAVEAEASVPDLADFERVALVWQGPTGLQLHALENGAGYDDPGHLWAEAPGSPDAAIQGEGGFVTILGSTATGFAADIYTYPVDRPATGSDPVISVEAQVMENTCGTQIAGSFLQVVPGEAPSVTDITMTEPGCDAVGEYLVLKNLPQDLKIARN